MGISKVDPASAGVGGGRVAVGVGDDIVIELSPTLALSKFGVGETTIPPMIIGVGVDVGSNERTSTWENQTEVPKRTSTVTKTTSAPQN